MDFWKTFQEVMAKTYEDLTRPTKTEEYSRRAREFGELREDKPSPMDEAVDFATGFGGITKVESFRKLLKDVSKLPYREKPTPETIGIIAKSIARAPSKVMKTLDDIYFASMKEDTSGIYRILPKELGPMGSRSSGKFHQVGLSSREPGPIVFLHELTHHAQAASHKVFGKRTKEQMEVLKAFREQGKRFAKHEGKPGTYRIDPAEVHAWAVSESLGEGPVSMEKFAKVFWKALEPTTKKASKRLEVFLKSQ